jgi:hypothetical protein
MKTYAFLFFIVSLLLISCSSKTDAIDLFFNQTCQYPCWNNIEPGKTTKQELLNLLAKQDSTNIPVDLASIHTMKYLDSGFEEFVGFSLSGNDVYVRAYISGGKVQLLSFESELKYELDITISQIIEQTQLPEKVFIQDSHDDYLVNLILPTTGVWYGYQVSSLTTSIKSSTPVGWIGFFDPNQFDLLFDANVFTFDTLPSDTLKAEMRDWNGFGKLNELYFP